MWRVLLLVCILSFTRANAATICACDPAIPDSMEARQCSLCREADKQAAELEVFLVKDISPRKPNRWLALPRAHGSGMHHLNELSKKQRTALWKEAIAKGRELWGEEWGLAYNGEQVRTQCHTHVHIGKLLKGIETDHFVTVRGPEEIPVPAGEGVWVHPDGDKLHVHLGEQTTETALLR